MRTGLKILSSGSVFFILLLFSCKSNDVEKDMEDWCGCQQEAVQDKSKAAECDKMMEEISRKYAFDPEAVVIIQTKALECKQ